MKESNIFRDGKKRRTKKPKEEDEKESFLEQLRALRRKLERGQKEED